MKSRALNNYIIINIETTGIDISKDEIIGLYAIKVENKIITDEFFELIKPKKRITKVVSEITHITNRMVSKCKKINDAIQGFVNFTNGYKIVGYNLPFDIAFINKYLQEKEKISTSQCIDVLKLVQKKYQNLSNYKLFTVANYLNISTKISECEIMKLIYENLCL